MSIHATGEIRISARTAAWISGGILLFGAIPLLVVQLWLLTTTRRFSSVSPVLFFLFAAFAIAGTSFAILFAILQEHTRRRRLRDAADLDGSGEA
jgi:hypothetical protein